MARSFDTSGTTLRQAMESRQIQLAIQSSLGKRVRALWPQLNPKDFDATWQPWLDKMMVLTSRAHGMSALAASIFYNDVRTTALGEPAPAGLAKPTDPPSPDWMRSAFGYTAAALLKDPSVAPGTPLSTTVGAAGRIAAAGGRQTILDTVRADPEAVGYYRVTDGDPCAFCAMLAGRGVTYLSEESANFESHDHCGCSGAPAFDEQQPLPAVSGFAADLYDQHARGQADPVAAFRKAWAEHGAAA